MTRAHLWAYAAPGLGVSFLSTLVLVMYLNFAADVLGASIGVVGTIFLVGKVWDAVSDPLAGNWSDRTRSRLGRRRSWMLASALPLFAFGAMAWAPPQGLSPFALHAWIAFSIVGFYTAQTMFDVPNMALGAELSHSQAERNRIFGVRQVVRTLGLFGSFGLGTYVLTQSADPRGAAVWLGVGVGLATAASIVWGVLALPPERSDYTGRGGLSLWKSMRDVWGNRLARLLLFVFFIESLGVGAIGALVPFVIRYVMKTPELVPAMLIVYTTSTLLAVPLWVRLARRFEKRRLWLWAMVQGGLGFGMLFWLGEGDWLLMSISSVVAGTANACGATLGQSLKADLIDVDEHATGERKEGAYFAAWSFVSKLATGVMIGITGIALDAAGYVENADQSETVKRAMILLMGGAPIVGYGIGTLAFLRFDLTQATHARIRSELDARAAARTP
ncbi:MAG: MFS transporter [Deltaproteobacteria bacterium]|nr:MFS transporter [Deltaproteobacteria bacterium]